MNYAAVLERAAARRPDHPAIRQAEWSLTYAEVAERSRRLGAALRQRGLNPGDRVVVLQANGPRLFETLFACWQQGLVCVPLNFRSTRHELEDICSDAEPRAVVCGSEYSDHLVGLPADVVVVALEPLDGIDDYEAMVAGAEPAATLDLDDSAPAWLLYTSGTTGRMKGATITHRSLRTMALSILAELLPLTGDEVLLHAAPLSHGSGLVSMIPVLVGATQVLTADRSYDPAEVLEMVSTGGVTHLPFLAPTMVRRLVEEQHRRPVDSSRLRGCLYGGAPMYVEDIKDAISTFGPIFVQGYGQAECPAHISRLTAREHAAFFEAGDDTRLGSVGSPYAAVDLRIDDDGVALPPGEVGEILVRSDAVMAGYWGLPEATAETLADGWLHTGDVGRLDPDGLLYLVDRSKDMIITGGSNVYPREVEEVVLTHASVREVCVVGAPDPEWGERVVAVLSVDEGVADVQGLAEEVTNVCRARLSGYKVPRQVEIVPELPKSEYGKILKREVRERLWQGHDRRI